MSRSGGGSAATLVSSGVGDECLGPGDARVVSGEVLLESLGHVGLQGVGQGVVDVAEAGLVGGGGGRALGRAEGGEGPVALIDG